MESQNNGGPTANGQSFANGDSMSSGNSVSDDIAVTTCRDQANDLRGLGLRLFPDKWAHTPNCG